ncbi:MAG: DUF4214 domain-containing protein, partial [Ruthenibacterium sp.]
APTAKVQKKAITATAAVSDKQYDGKTDATVNFTFKDNVATDTVSATATAAFSSKDAGKKIAVTLTGFKLDATSALYYTCTAPSGVMGNITPKTIEVTAGTLKIEKEYDGTTAFTNANASGKLVPTDVHSGDVVNVTISKYGDAPNKNAGAQKITLTLAVDNANYMLKNTTYPDFAAKITQKPLKDTMFKAIAAQTYTGSEITPAIVIAYSENTRLNDNDFTVTYANNTDVGTAATAKIVAKTSGNYSGSVTQKFTINKASCIVTVEPGKGSYPTTEDITFTASVTMKGTSKGVEGGTVTFYLGTAGGTKLGDAKVVNGKATLTVKAGDGKIGAGENQTITAVYSGSGSVGGETGTGTVTAEEKRGDVTEIRLDVSSMKLIVGTTGTLTATVLPADAANQHVTWSSDNAAIVSVENGQLTALKVGTTRITCMADNHVSASCTVAVRAVPESGVSGFVERLYSVALGRESDEKGKKDWTGALQGGTITGAQVAANFLLGSEMTGRRLSNEEFLTVIYETFFDRDPDSGGFNTWLGLLNNGVSREFIIAGFANGAEFQKICETFAIKRGDYTSKQARDVNPKLTAFVNRLYTKLLDRGGEEEGLNTWCREILKKTRTPKEVASGFVFSNEFIGRKFDDATYVEYLYRTFMGRDSDVGGKAMWVKYLKDGHSREEVFNGFADSAEFADIVNSFGL